MKKSLMILSLVFFTIACGDSKPKKTKFDELECECTIVSINRQDMFSLNEVIISDRNGKVHTFTHYEPGVTSIINQEVGYKFGGVNGNTSIKNDTLNNN